MVVYISIPLLSKQFCLSAGLTLDVKCNIWFQKDTSWEPLLLRIKPSRKCMCDCVCVREIKGRRSTEILQQNREETFSSQLGHDLELSKHRHVRGFKSKYDITWRAILSIVRIKRKDQIINAFSLVFNSLLAFIFFLISQMLFWLRTSWNLSVYHFCPIFIPKMCDHTHLNISMLWGHTSEMSFFAASNQCLCIWWH